VPTLVLGVESPHPESTARAIAEVCDARLSGSLADEALLNASIRSSGELGDPTAKTISDLRINSVHTWSVPPHACHGKFKIPLVVESEDVAHRLADADLERGEQSWRGGMTIALVDLAVILFQSDRVPGASVGPFLVRNWFGHACSCSRAEIGIRRSPSLNSLHDDHEVDRLGPSQG
jgi:hypothetical protein